MLSIAQIRAIELRRAIVRNVDAGCSGIVDSNGVLRTPVPDWVIRDPTSVGQIPIDSRWTLFVLWGDWLSIIAVVAVIGVDGRQAIRRIWRPVPRLGRDPDRSVMVAEGG
jgi:apolipoprotein N-acyltransferase